MGIGVIRQSFFDGALSMFIAHPLEEFAFVAIAARMRGMPVSASTGQMNSARETTPSAQSSLHPRLVGARMIGMTELPRENVQSYPRPPILEPVPQRIVVRLGGALVAESARALRVLETHHAPTYYIPAADVTAALRPAAGETICEWKGAARYFDVLAGTAVAKRAAWSYPKPTPPFEPLANHIAFYAGLMDEAWVGDVKVLPQPGAFYGGWITPNLEGRIKGAPGTRHW